MVSSLLSLFLFATTVISTYAPLPTTCPSGPLVRPASGLSNGEAAYIAARKPVADANLKAWLHQTNAGFGTDELPTVCSPDNGP